MLFQGSKGDAGGDEAHAQRCHRQEAGASMVTVSGRSLTGERRYSTKGEFDTNQRGEILFPDYEGGGG